MDPVRGVLFQNRFDRKIVCVDPQSPPGSNTTRVLIKTEMYENVVIYDHIVTQRI